jgi:O-methyltransferase involved in polyketide biosynthesis
MTQHAPGLDAAKPHSARIWNYWLGGKDHFAADREYADQFIEIYPGIVNIARASRAFLGRVVRYLAGEAKVRQFLDVGTGLPTADNTHEVAQRVDPECRIVYVDNDPLVLVHARALLTGTDEGATAYIDADVREPEKILAVAAETLDFTRPIALLMLGVMGNIPDDGEAYGLVGRLADALPSGSYLALLDGTDVLRGAERRESILRLRESTGVEYRNRSPDQIARFFAGFELLEPGVVSASRWRPDPGPAGPPAEVDAFCGVGRKP